VTVSPELLAEHLWTPPVGWAAWTVFAVLDCARDKRILKEIRRSDLQYDCLYEGEVPRALVAVAPHIVALERGMPFTELLLTEGWAENWGIFTAGPVGLVGMRRHLRKFLKVRGPEGVQMYFRYYDPRVLRTYLPSCNSKELQFLFGPIEAYFAEAESGDELIRFNRKFDPISMGVSSLVATSLTAHRAPTASEMMLEPLLSAPLEPGTVE
jgi:hypothetical protein